MKEGIDQMIDGQLRHIVLHIGGTHPSSDRVEPSWKLLRGWNGSPGGVLDDFGKMFAASADILALQVSAAFDLYISVGSVTRIGRQLRYSPGTMLMLFDCPVWWVDFGKAAEQIASS